MSASTSGARPAVKNLRAMFENKSSDQTTSPPSRSRSSNGSSSSQTSRQVNKIRASFVAVERPGEAGQSPQWGLRKTSDVSSMAEVREEAIIDHNNNNDSAAQSATMSSAVHTDLGDILKGSPFESYPSAPVGSGSNVSAAASKPVTAHSLEKPKLGRTGSNKKVAALIGSMQSSEQQSTANTATATESKPPKSIPIPAALNTKTAASKPKESPTLTKKSPTLQKKDSPVTINGNGLSIKPKGGVSKIVGVMQSSNKAKEERAKAEQNATPAPESRKTTPKDVKIPPVTSKPAAALKAHAPKQDKSAAGVEQVKSPTSTRSTKLPSAATAGTAASAARKGTYTDEETKPVSSEKKTSIPQAPRVAAVLTRASLAKKSSRASLANGEDRPRSRVSAVHKPADEGFLARMTRPTASSARRAQETVQAGSPPRARPSAGQDVTKKATRKSLSINAKPASAADTGNETALDPVNENNYTGGLEHDEGEPGPAEEEDVYDATQPAGVGQRTL